MIQHSEHSIAPPNEVQPPWYFPIPAGRFTEIVAQWFIASFWPMPWPLMRPAGAARWWQDCGTVNCGSISAVTSCHIESPNLLVRLSTCQSNVVDCVALHEAIRCPHTHISKAGMDYHHHQAIAATFKVADRIAAFAHVISTRPVPHVLFS